MTILTTIAFALALITLVVVATRRSTRARVEPVVIVAWDLNDDGDLHRARCAYPAGGACDCD